MAEPHSADHGHSLLLQTRLRLLLGLPGRQPQSLAAAVTGLGVELQAEDSWLQACDSLSTDEVSARRTLPVVDCGPMPEVRSGDSFAEALFLRDGALSESILTRGVSLESYRLVESPEDGGCQVLFGDGAEESWSVIGRYDTVEQATEATNRTRRALGDVSLRSEGLHIVEHLLLRPSSGASAGDWPGPDFYSFRVSIVLPCWTARFGDERFRSMAEELIRQNLPAHIVPSLLWLTHPEMTEFEARLQRWREADQATASAKLEDTATATVEAKDTAAVEELDRLAADLVEILAGFQQAAESAPELTSVKEARVAS